MEQKAQATVPVALLSSDQGLSAPGLECGGGIRARGPLGTSGVGTPCETSTEIMNVSSANPRVGLGNVSEQGSSLQTPVGSSVQGQKPCGSSAGCGFGCWEVESVLAPVIRPSTFF